MVLPLARAPLFAQSQYGQYPQPQPYAQQSYAAQNQRPSSQAYAQSYLPQDDGQPQPQGLPLTAEQLEQLLAPIALYPDTLVAETLAAATYPAQVVGADHWLRAQGYASPDQIAAGADVQAWDPSVKALTAFPQVLAQMDRSLQWTTDLGNAYYNQPQDVLQTVQVLRQRARAAGTLQNTPQEALSYNQGYIQLAPVNPQVVYVPAYNPWDVYGQPVTPDRNFSLLGSLASLAGSSPVKYGLGIAMSAFNHTPFGWATWALNWLTQSVLFNQSNYQSNSTSVAHWAYPSSGGYRQAAMPRQPGANNWPYAANRPDERFHREYPAQPGNYSHPAFQAYNRFQPSSAMTARQQAEARSGYGSGFYGGSPQVYSRRPATAYPGPQSTWRAPTQRQNFAQRPYSGDKFYSASAGRGFGESSAKPAHTGGFHLLGGGHNAEKSFHGGHAPKNYSSGKSFSKGHSGGGHSGGHHGGRHRH